MIRAGLRGHPILWSFAGSVLLAATLGLTLGNAFGDEEAHLIAHLTLGLPALLLLVAGLQFWPDPRSDRYSRIARHGLLIAIALLATGSSLEAVGAIGAEEMLGVSSLEAFHPVGVVIGAGGVALALAAVGANLLVWGMARAGKLEATWMPYAMGLICLGAMAFILGAFVFDY